MARIVCSSCRRVMHYLPDLCEGPLSCPDCGESLGEANPAPLPPPSDEPPTAPTLGDC
jgi:hypothetical protein